MNDHHWDDLDSLILIPGHAIYVAPDFERPYQDESWALEPYQQGETRFFLEHVTTGIELAESQSDALLIFSGGQTKQEAGPRSEASSYWLVAEHVVRWGKEVRSRATTEEYARDSYENLVFALCRFYECTGRFPLRLTVINWGFKEERFDLHRATIRLPRDCYDYLGVNNPPDIEQAEEREAITISRFARDPHGILLAPQKAPRQERLGYLGEKRLLRNPFKRHAPYPLTCPPLRELLLHERPIPFSGPLPWSSGASC